MQVDVRVSGHANGSLLSKRRFISLYTHRYALPPSLYALGQFDRRDMEMVHCTYSGIDLQWHCLAGPFILQETPTHSTTVCKIRTQRPKDNWGPLGDCKSLSKLIPVCSWGFAHSDETRAPTRTDEDRQVKGRVSIYLTLPYLALECSTRTVR